MKTKKQLQASRKYRLRHIYLSAVLLAGLIAVVYTSRDVVVLAAGPHFEARVSYATDTERYRPHSMRITKEYYRYVTFAIPKEHCPRFDHAALNCQQQLRISSNKSAYDLQRFDIESKVMLAHTPLFPDTYVVVDRQGDVKNIISAPLSMLALTLLSLGAVLQTCFGVRLTMSWPPRGRGRRWVAGSYAGGLILLLTSVILQGSRSFVGFGSYVGIVWTIMLGITVPIVALAVWLVVRKKAGKRS